MDIVRLAITKPVGVTVGVLLVLMFGVIGLTAIPVQLTPTVDRPVITVTTNWPGRSPDEIVDEITQEQEERLKNVSNLKSMRSLSSEGQAVITLEFYIGASIERALQEVSDALRQVPDYPDEVDEPTIKAAEGSSENAIAWIIIDVDPAMKEQFADFDITRLYDPLDKEVKPFLERIDGVAEINIYGGRERELRVYVDPVALAQRSLTYQDVLEALRRENRNVSAGTIAEGKRDYRIRVIGQFTRPDQVLETVVAYREGKPVFVKDVAEVELGYQKQRGFVRSFGYPSIAMNCIRQSGANVVDVMDELRTRLAEVQSDLLPLVSRQLAGLPEDHPGFLRLRQVYDETIYIDSAISLVTQNLWVGGSIAAFVLLIFLRSFISTMVIALAIPISVIATFLVMFLGGRTLNVISLAGLAFAVGMVVDNAIVVLENIYRKRQEGLPALEAAYQGGKEVWGAILASTLTTVAVFIPVLTIQEEAGQLFRDIAIAIVAAVSLSLIVSITVIPSATSRWLAAPSKPGGVLGMFNNLFGLVPVFARVNEVLSGGVRWAMGSWRGWTVRPLIIVVLTAVSVAGAVALMPPLDYLPAGNRNLVFGGMLIPPGYSIDQKELIAERIESQILPYAEADIDDANSVAALPTIPRFDAPNEPFNAVPVENFFIGAFGSGMFAGATSQNDRVVIPVGQLLSNAMQSIPDTFGGASQSSIFGQGVGGGNTIDIEISGPRLPRVRDAAGMVFGLAAQKYGYGNVRPDPANFNLRQQEQQVRLNDAGRELGLRTADVGTAIRALFDGAYVDDYRYAGEAIDLTLLPAGGELAYKEQLASVPIATPAGVVVPIDSVVDVVPALAPQEIQRIEELSSVTIRITPPEGEALEDVMQVIREQMIAPAEQAGLIDASMRVRLEGTAARLDEVKAALFGKPASGRTNGLRTTMTIISGLIMLGGLGFAFFAAFRAVRMPRHLPRFLYGASGGLLLAAILASLVFAIGAYPQLGMARFVWALIVTYLLMAALFESFIDPFVIMFSVPLAVVGGFGGLRIVHDITMADPTIAPQQLDVLTMLGFVILIGVVVNNAILIVHQALNNMREMKAQDKPIDHVAAMAESVRTRVRPIFMSVLTSVGGMLPLVLFPGAGSEMYRGLGSVVIGGLLVSTVFTLLLVPLLYSLVTDMRLGVRAVIKPSRLDETRQA